MDHWHNSYHDAELISQWYGSHKMVLKLRLRLGPSSALLFSRFDRRLGSLTLPCAWSSDFKKTMDTFKIERSGKLTAENLKLVQDAIARSKSRNPCESFSAPEHWSAQHQDAILRLKIFVRNQEWHMAQPVALTLAESGMDANEIPSFVHGCAAITSPSEDVDFTALHATEAIKKDPADYIAYAAMARCLCEFDPSSAKMWIQLAHATCPRLPVFAQKIEEYIIWIESVSTCSFNVVAAKRMLSTFISRYCALCISLTPDLHCF